MSRNVDLLRRLYESWNREGLGWFEIAQDFLDPAVEFREPPEFPGAGTYRGVEGWQAALARQFEAWERILFEPEEFLENGDDILATVRVRTLARETQIENERTIFHLVTFRADRILRMHVSFDRTSALRALGLESDEPGEAPLFQNQVDA